MLTIPNIPHESVPIEESEDNNVVINESFESGLSALYLAGPLSVHSNGPTLRFILGIRKTAFTLIPSIIEKSKNNLVTKQEAKAMREAFQTITRSLGVLNKTCCSVDGIDVSAVQSHILYEIDVNDTPSMQQVADLLGIEMTTFSRQIQTLVNMELVKKVPSVEDKRVSLLKLTEKGEKVAKGIDEQVNVYLEVIFSQMTDFERETTQRAVKLIAEVMTKSSLCYGILKDDAKC